MRSHFLFFYSTFNFVLRAQIQQQPQLLGHHFLAKVLDHQRLRFSACCGSFDVSIDRPCPVALAFSSMYSFRAAAADSRVWHCTFSCLGSTFISLANASSHCGAEKRKRCPCSPAGFLDVFPFGYARCAHILFPVADWEGRAQAVWRGRFGARNHVVKKSTQNTALVSRSSALHPSRVVEELNLGVHMKLVFPKPDWPVLWGRAQELPLPR
jgi:hypothetical protein